MQHKNKLVEGSSEKVGSTIKNELLKFLSLMFKKYIFIHQNKSFLAKVYFSSIKNCATFPLVPSIINSNFINVLFNYIKRYLYFSMGDPWGQCYKTFYGRNLRVFVMS